MDRDWKSLSVTELKKEAIKPPKFSGVGGLKLKTNSGVYRFYNENLIDRHTDQVHTHTYGFNSIVLKGTLRNIIYNVTSVDEDTQYCLTQGECIKGCQPDVISENVTVQELFVTDMPVGTTYRIDPTTFHRVEFITDSVVTYLAPPNPHAGNPMYVMDKSIGYICPWGDTMLSSKDCWEIIDQILSN